MIIEIKKEVFKLIFKAIEKGMGVKLGDYYKRRIIRMFMFNLSVEMLGRVLANAEKRDAYDYINRYWKVRVDGC